MVLLSEELLSSNCYGFLFLLLRRITANMVTILQTHSLKKGMMKKKYFKHSTKHPIDVHGGSSICHVFPGAETSAKFPGVVGSIQAPKRRQGL